MYIYMMEGTFGHGAVGAVHGRVEEDVAPEALLQLREHLRGAGIGACSHRRAQARARRGSLECRCMLIEELQCRSTSGV